jgi:hypothetical protein
MLKAKHWIGAWSRTRKKRKPGKNGIGFGIGCGASKEGTIEMVAAVAVEAGRR